MAACGVWSVCYEFLKFYDIDLITPKAGYARAARPCVALRHIYDQQKYYILSQNFTTRHEDTMQRMQRWNLSLS